MYLIHYVILIGKVDMFHFFLESGFDIEAKCTYSWTPLHLASFLGLKDFIDILLFYGADPNVVDDFGVNFFLIKHLY